MSFVHLRFYSKTKLMISDFELQVTIHDFDKPERLIKLRQYQLQYR
ncbi:hypothetical protein B816_505 [Weissella confusa]|nr:hypothetical protein [Weissella confusa]